MNTKAYKVNTNVWAQPYTEVTIVAQSKTRISTSDGRKYNFRPTSGRWIEAGVGYKPAELELNVAYAEERNNRYNTQRAIHIEHENMLEALNTELARTLREDDKKLSTERMAQAISVLKGTVDFREFARSFINMAEAPEVLVGDVAWSAHVDEARRILTA